MLETCRFAANDKLPPGAGDAPYIAIRESTGDGAAMLHYDGAGRGMPGGLCGAIRFAGLDAGGPPGIAAEGHRRALSGLLPEIRAIAADLAAHYVPGTPVYGRPLPDIDALLAGRGLAESLCRRARYGARARGLGRTSGARPRGGRRCQGSELDGGGGLLQHHRPPGRAVPGRRPQRPRSRSAAAEPRTMGARGGRRRQGPRRRAGPFPRIPPHAVLGCYRRSRRAARTGRRWRWRRPGQRADGVHRPRQRHRRRQRQPHRRSRRPRPWPDQRGAGRHGRADGRRRRFGAARIHSLHRQVGSMSSNPSGRSPTVSSRPCSASC